MFMSFWLLEPLLEMVASGLKTKSLGVRPDEQHNLSKFTVISQYSLET